MNPTTQKLAECKHENFRCECVVNRLEDSGQFMLEIKVFCAQCDLPFRFKGLSMGLNLHGATCNADATEARIAIVPSNQENNPLQAYKGVTGIKVSVSKTRPNEQN